MGLVLKNNLQHLNMILSWFVVQVELPNAVEELLPSARANIVRASALVAFRLELSIPRDESP